MVDSEDNVSKEEMGDGGITGVPTARIYQLSIIMHPSYASA